MWDRFLDAFFPALCELCEESLQKGNTLCEACFTGLTRVTPPFCVTCGEGFEGNISEKFRCPNCHQLDFSFDFARAALSSSDDARFLVHRFKYQRSFYLAKTLAAFIEEAAQKDERLSSHSSAVIVPVPLFWWREQKRGANQAYEIARQLKVSLGLPLVDCLKRQRSTITQTQLPRKERLKNLKGAFVLRKKFEGRIQGKTIFLVDDVFTTGATAHECAKVLKKSGKAERIIVLTVMRG